MVLACCAVLTWPASPAPLWGQEPTRPKIAAVSFHGLQRTSEALARQAAGLRVGDAVDPAALEQAVSRLLQTGQFVNASYRLDQTDDGVRVEFEVEEIPTVSSIHFEGNHHFSDSHLKAQVPVKAGDTIDRFAIRDGREAIEAAYREDGFNDVTVSYDAERLEAAGELVYTVNEGKRVRIRTILFEGNTAFSDRVLRRHVDTKTALWIFRSGAFDKDRVESDVARLQRFYRDKGFLDATVSYRRRLSEDGTAMTLIFSVDEGTRYAVESIDFRGNTVFTRDELLALMDTELGATIERPQVDADVRAIRTRYGELGYIYATVRAIRVFSQRPGLVRLTVEIDEGQQYRVGRVVVRGNDRTKDKVVRRALDLYPPDDLFDLTEAREAQQRLLDTRIFSSARVYPAGNQPGVRDAIIDVQEAPKAGDFLFGVGVTSNSGLVGNVVLNLQNFDLFDWPRSWSELTRFRAFSGAGQRLRLELQPGTTVSRFRIDFTEPYLLDRPVRFDSSVFLFERRRDGYDEERAGLTLSLGKRFRRGRLYGWSGEIALRIEDVGVDDVDLFASREIRRDEGSNLLTSLKATMVRDRTDNRFVPTTGDRLRLGYEQVGVLGGDHVFGKLSAGYARYWTLHTDALDRKTVLQLRGEGGLIMGDAPIFERFYAGGTGSIRGFAFRGVGPRDGIDDNVVGGDVLLLAGGEYSFPLMGENVRGLIFVDSGTIDFGTWRASLGTGVRLTLPIFRSPVPLELDLAIPISSSRDDDEQVFAFLVGTLF